MDQFDKDRLVNEVLEEVERLKALGFTQADFAKVLSAMLLGETSKDAPEGDPLN